MANVFIQTIRIVDMNRTVLPFDPVSGGFVAVADPATSLTPALNIEVTCVLIPAGGVQLAETATNINTGDFNFTAGDGHTINYVRQVTGGTPFYLAFQLQALKPPASCLPADLLIQVIGDNTAQQVVRLIVK